MREHDVGNIHLPLATHQPQFVPKLVKPPDNTNVKSGDMKTHSEQNTCTRLYKIPYNCAGKTLNSSVADPIRAPPSNRIPLLQNKMVLPDWKYCGTIGDSSSNVAEKSHVNRQVAVVAQ